MTMIIDEKRIPIKVDLLELQVTRIPEEIKIGGETDEEFASRRNSFLRWVLGFPKVRWVPTGSIMGKLRSPDPLMIITEEMKFFRNWPLDLFPLKNDCLICSLNEKDYVKLIGCYPVDFNGDKLLMMYDAWEEHGNIFNEE